MIPDDAVIVIVEKDTEVRQVEKPSGVIQMGPRGLPGILDPEAVAHLLDVSTNQHEDSFSDLTAPSGNDDKWVKIDGDAIVTTDEIPLYPEDIRPPTGFDEKVRVDETTEQSSLSNHIRFPLHVNYGSPEGEHRWRMKGDRSISRTVSFPGEFTENVVVPGEIPTRIPVTYPNNTVFDVSDRVPRRSYYGTDCAGTVGFHIVPGKQVIP